MLKSPVMHIICAISWLLVSLAAINYGLQAFGYGDFLTSDFVMRNMDWIIKPAKIAILVAGIISLITFLIKMAGGGCCGDASCR